MKWGVRRAKSSSSSSGKSSKKPSLKSRISEAKKKRSKDSAKNLSDKELRRRIERLELEKRYNNLKTGDTRRGSRLAREILESSGRAIAQEVIRYGVGSGINAIAGTSVVSLQKKKGK